MARIREKSISILGGNLNSGRSYLITAVTNNRKILICKIFQEYWLEKQLASPIVNFNENALKPSPEIDDLEKMMIRRFLMTGT